MTHPFLSHSSSRREPSSLLFWLVIAVQSIALIALALAYRTAAADLHLLHSHLRNVATTQTDSLSDSPIHSCADSVRRAERVLEDRFSALLLQCELDLTHLRRDPRHSALVRKVHVLSVRANACASSRAADDDRRRRLAYVLPFVESQIPRLVRLLQDVWSLHPPCNVSAPVYAPHVSLVLYAARPLGADARAHARLVDSLTVALEAGGSRPCWAAVRVAVANMTRVPANATTERYARKPVADQFFRTIDMPALRDNADYFAYMEPDTLPVRALWLDRLYEQVEHGGDFWLKGSLYRGANKPLDFCYTLCGCAEHINGNAIHALQDERYLKFLRSVHRQMDFMSFNYDAFIMNRLKTMENWQFFQEHAHRFQYTEFIQHGQHDLKVEQLVQRYPDTYLVHQPLLG